MAEIGRQGGEPPCCVIIPARYASSRFPGKPLARLRGAGGVERSLIEWTWRTAREVGRVASVVVATDDRRIAEEVERFGGQAVMTPEECANGTERCAAAVAELGQVPEIVINLQGDAPLTLPAMVEALAARMVQDPALPVATPAIACTPEITRHLLADRAAGRVGGTTVVLDDRGGALYFSKSVVPFVPEGLDFPVHLHLGVYAYRADALAAYAALPPSPLEMVEGLEQLRFLAAGIRVGVVVCDRSDGLIVELNNPQDVPLIEGELQRRGMT